LFSSGVRVLAVRRAGAFVKTSSARVSASLAFFLIASIPAWAQYHAGFQGVVTDPSGAVTPGATVIATNKATGFAQTATSSNSGTYSIGALAGGTYTVSVEKTGFAKQVLESVELQSETVQSLNLTLSVGQTATTVTVSADMAPVINTESAEIGGNITQKDVENLPSIGRDPYQLLRLAPGVFGDGAIGSNGNASSIPGTNIGAGSGIFSVENGVQMTANGSRQNANSFSIDGVPVNSAVWGGAPVVTPSEETVKEVKIIANNYSAENGRGSGAQVEVVSQSGTNDLHGSAFFKWHRPALNAYNRWNGMSASQNAFGDWTETDNPRTKDTQRFNQFGGSFGGPIIRNKLFAFFAYETQRNSSQSVGTGWYATPQFIKSAATPNSIASKILGVPGETPVYTLIIPESCAGVGLSASQCQNTPGGGLDLGSPLKNGLGNSDPTFGAAATPYGIGGGFDGVPDVEFLQTNSPSINNNAQYNGRLDYHPTALDLVAFGIYWTPVYTEDYNGPAYSANLYKHYSLAQAWDGIWDHNFSANLLNELRIGGSGWKWNELTSNPQEPYGLPDVNFQPNGANIYGGLGSNAQLQGFGPPGPSVFNQFTYSYRDTLTMIRGSHSIKFGADVTHAKFLDTAPWNAIPSYQFDNIWDFANDAAYSESANFNPVTGTPTSTTKNLRDGTIAGFVQDDWKVSSSLTVNLGLRWEDFVPPTETKGNISNVVLGAGSDILTGLSIKKGGSLYKNVYTNFEPQLGFAWSPQNAAFGHKMVLRGGFGMGYNLEQFAITSNGRFDPPFLNSLTLYGSNILYAAGSNVHDISSYPSNPIAVQSFGSNGLPTGGTGLNLTGFPQNFPPAVTYRYSLETQFDLGHNWMASAGYTGSQSRHLTRQYSNLNWLFYPNINPVVNSVDWYTNDANSHYNALLTEVQHRFSSMFEIDFQYKYSSSIDDGTQDYNTDLYPWNRSFTYGPSDFDTKHNYKIWGMFTPKFTKTGHGLVDKVLGGWTISGIINGHSGFPWTPQYCPGSTIEYSGSGIGCLFPQSYAGGATNFTNNNAFETPFGNFQQNATAASGQVYFTVPSAAALAPGIPPPPSNIHRNMFRGPTYFGNDVQVAKAFGLPKLPGLGEDAKLNLQMNFYNLINKENLQNIGGTQTIGGPQFGVSQGGLAGRIVELQARFSF
jgi:hypothetical protein